MSTANITPPSVNGSVNYFTGKDQVGAPIQYGVSVVGRRADAAITRGQALVYVAPVAGASPPATSLPLSVAPCADADLGFEFAGVALESAAEGDIVPVALDVAYARVASSVTAGTGLQMSAAGELDDASATDEETGAATSVVAYAISASIADYWGTGDDAVLAKLVLT